ncbi:hypothetical protein SLNSH_01350 [Alsobacter soli]|uniref:Uncharacterized protein n=1 Tax=Alsobacter soli TaxID=2109933 RepID=A0A2T1I017_9HYPH|nr:hypothetical protein [Alsobacter soli]PSC07049.1 hypothetical protein SLNSH_01350 [Alsobacter soli]
MSAATASVISRVEVVLRTVELDCACRARLTDALARFAELEARREARRELAESRRQRDLIAGIVALMSDLDEIACDEADASVYAELAYLFDDVAEAARKGAGALRSLAAGSGEPPSQDAAALRREQRATHD